MRRIRLRKSHSAFGQLLRIGRVRCAALTCIVPGNHANRQSVPCLVIGQDKHKVWQRGRRRGCRSLHWSHAERRGCTSLDPTSCHQCDRASSTTAHCTDASEPIEHTAQTTHAGPHCPDYAARSRGDPQISSPGTSDPHSPQEIVPHPGSSNSPIEIIPDTKNLFRTELALPWVIDGRFPGAVATPEGLRP